MGGVGGAKERGEIEKFLLPWRCMVGMNILFLNVFVLLSYLFLQDINIEVNILTSRGGLKISSSIGARTICDW